MKHSIDVLVALAHYYQHNALWFFTQGEEGRGQAAERRLAAGELAGAKYPMWRAMHKRLREQLPGCAVHDHSFYLQARPSCDGPFWAHIELPILLPEIGFHELTFYLSTLAPYYIILREISYYIPGTASKPWADRDSVVPKGNSCARHAMSFELTPEEEEPYARVLAAEIERTFGYEPMPPEIGKEVVPDVATNQSGIGDTTIYDCLFVGHW